MRTRRVLDCAEAGLEPATHGPSDICSDPGHVAAPIAASPPAATSAAGPHDVAVRDDEGALGRDAQVDRDARVTHEHPVFAVDRDEVRRPKDVEQELELLLARVSGDVRTRVRLVDHFGPQLEEVIDGP